MTVIAVHSEESLLRSIKATPIIDHHAHALLNPSSVGNYPLLCISTEANGDALASTKTSLPHFRAVRQLSAVLGCEPTWGAVQEAIQGKQKGEDYGAWTRRCLSGIESVLVDDGLGSTLEMEPYNHFDSFTRSPSKRIVRIEYAAAEIIDQARFQYQTASEASAAIIEKFSNVINESIADPEVVGFKSVICYRTGLAIPRRIDLEATTECFQEIFIGQANKFTRLDHPGLNEYFVHRAASLIRDSQDSHKKPIQFHTGLGDNDITLTKSSPAHLQEFIREYPTVPIVLLHASYPYMREAAYLASVYANVYADIGEVFPAVSRQGQEAVVRQTLELCPYSKILWSTDGHYFPETYLLAVEQVREVLHTVLVEYVHKDDLTWSQATSLVQDIFFHNANQLYNLGLQYKPVDTNTDTDAVVPGKEKLETLTRFLADNEEVRFLRVYWTDTAGLSRMRTLPIRRALSLLRGGGDLVFGVTEAALGLLQNDHLAPGCSPTGEYNLIPDLQSLRLGPRKGHATTRGEFKEKSGSDALYCARSLLKRTLNKAAEQGLEFTLGFEIEFVLMHRGEKAKFEPLRSDGHAWSVGRAMEHQGAMEVIEAAIERLDEAGVHIEMVHPEAANGQYEIVLPRAGALQAVDTVMFARDVISNCATERGFKMTLHPKPFADSCGTAAHVHMSISSPNGSDKEVYEPFYAGLLKHLRAVMAFTYSSVTSYERAVDGCWAGGTWVTWGTQNREAPLRKIEGSHWEMKCMDGVANPYLALSAVFLAGLQGVANKEALLWQDCAEDPAVLSEAERERLHIMEKQPASVTEALEALQDDKELGQLMGPELVQRYVAVKKMETELLESMGDEERRLWVMERY